jgi:hypothetical protein
LAESNALFFDDEIQVMVTVPSPRIAMSGSWMLFSLVVSNLGVEKVTPWTVDRAT